MADETTQNPGQNPGEFQGKDFGAGGAATAVGAGRPIDFLLDVPLTLSVELGRSRVLVNDLLQLGQGSVVELTKIVGEPLEVLVNEKLIARGEVVVLNDKFAVRLTDIISPKDRLDKLS